MLWSGGAAWWRALGRSVVVAVILALPVAVHVAWVQAADDAFTDRVAVEEESDATVPSPTIASPSSGTDPEAQDRAEAQQRYQTAGLRRSGRTVVRVEKDPVGEWKAKVRHELTLRSDDPMTADLRSRAQDLEAWLPFTLTITSYPGSEDCERAYEDSRRSWLEQRGPQQAVQGVHTSELSWSETNWCLGESTAVVVTLVKGWNGKAGLYEDWTFVVESGVRPPFGVVGAATLSQSANRVELRLPEGRKTVVELTESDDTVVPSFQGPTDLEVFATWLQEDASPTLEAVLLLAALTVLTCCWAVPFIRGWAQPAACRRWIVLTLTAGGLTCATLTYDLLGVHPLWQAWWAYPGRGQLLVTWWWVLLPFLLGAFAVRVASGRPPRSRDLLPFTAPSMALLVPVAVLSVTDPSVLALAPAAGGLAAAVLTSHALRRGVLGQVGQRWRATCVGAVLLTALALGPGTGLPARVDFPDNADDYEYHLVVPWAWANLIASSTLNWLWPATLCTVVAAFAWRRWLAPALALLLWCAMTLPDLAWWASTEYIWARRGADRPWTYFGVEPEWAASAPLTVLQTTALCTALLFLWRCSRQDQRWPSSVRAAALSLGVTAAATPLTLSWFTLIADDSVSSGPYLALTLGTLGFAWLLPRSAAAKAARLNNTSPRAHSRRMRALLKDQAMAAGRRDFLATSRSDLASGDLSTSQWSARWRELGGLAGQRSLALRLAALGTSGGHGAWGSGVMAAGLLAFLSLPWFILALPSYLDDLVLPYDLPAVIDALSYAARWPLYGFVYGYAYSWLRGRTPLAKAMCLLIVVLPVESAQLLDQDLALNAFGARVLLSAGNCLAAFLILGLYWEARLVRSAGLRWGQIRNFRTLSALAVPVTTVFVAVATAMATAIIGIWIAPSGESPADPPKGAASVSESPTPRPGP